MKTKMNISVGRLALAWALLMVFATAPLHAQTGFIGATEVTFGGVKATNFTVVSPTLIQAIVPTGARTGKVVVTTRNGTARSKQTFTVN